MNEHSSIPETRWVFIHPFQLRLQRGIEVYLWNLASALALQGIQVDILTWDGPLDIPDYARIPGVSIHKVPAVRYFQALFAVPYYIYWLLKGNFQHAFVHFAGYGEGSALRFIRWVRSTPFSVVFHFPPSLVPHRFREFERWNFQRDARHLIAVSRATAKEVEKWSGRPCKVIEHGVDVDRFRPDPVLRAQIRRDLEIGEDVPLLISVAALEERKGLQRVIQCMPMLLKENPKVHYIIIGDGQYRSRLSALVSELCLGSRVHLVGTKINVHPYLCAADIMMVLSQGEASSISLLEALACELAAITSSRPPFDELMSNAWGVRVNETDIRLVASTILRLIKNPDERIAMGKAGRARVIAHHAWSMGAKQYKGLMP